VTFTPPDTDKTIYMYITNSDNHVFNVKGFHLLLYSIALINHIRFTHCRRLLFDFVSIATTRCRCKMTMFHRHQTYEIPVVPLFSTQHEKGKHRLFLKRNIKKYQKIAIIPSLRALWKIDLPCMSNKLPR